MDEATTLVYPLSKNNSIQVVFRKKTYKMNFIWNPERLSH